MRHPGKVERLQQLRRLLRDEGPRPVAARLLDRASRRLAPPGLGRLPVAREDLRRAFEITAAGGRLPEPLPAAPGEPLTIAWLSTPPQRGSGGHGTMLRLVSAFERAGHRCIVYLHDPHAQSHAENVAVVREWWPEIEADVRPGAGGIEDAHAIFATGWPAAHPVVASPARGARFYLVMDYEPWFFPAGSESLLIESTYRLPLHAVTLGRYLADRLRGEYGMVADHFDFGLDREVYGLDRAPGADAARAGVCWYARPSTPRRAFELAVAALEVFHERHPQVEIHTYGGGSIPLPFPVTEHGKLTGAGLNALYNRCVAGLALSATNVSLVPLEMLAAGCIPVVNDAAHNRAVLANDAVAYAGGTPFELADALGALVERPPAARAAAAERAAAGVVHAPSWEQSTAGVVDLVEHAVRSAQPAEAVAR